MQPSQRQRPARPSPATGSGWRATKPAAWTAFAGSTQISQIKRSFPELAEFLFRDNSFPRGTYLMTGTGVVPPDAFTLRSGDEMVAALAAFDAAAAAALHEHDSSRGLRMDSHDRTR